MSASTKFPVTFKQAYALSLRTMIAGLTPMVHGDPAIGKSAIALLIAKKLNLFLIDWRGTTADPIDLSGLPDMQGSKAVYKPFDTFPLSTDVIPEGYDGWLLFMDEFNSAPRAVTAAAYKLILDRKVGNHDLHPEVRIMAAGNLSSSGAIVNEQGTAMASRLIHLNLIANANEWIAHAVKAKYDPRIIAYIAHRPSQLYVFKPDLSEFTFPSPRTYEFVSKILKDQEFTTDLLPLIAGTIGDGAAIQLHAFYKVANELPSLGEIIANPELAKLPSEGSHQFATIGMLVDGISLSNAKPLMQYISRLNREHQYLIVKMFIESKPDLLAVTEVDEWVDLNAEFVYGK